MYLAVLMAPIGFVAEKGEQLISAAAWTILSPTVSTYKAIGHGIGLARAKTIHERNLHRAGLDYYFPGAVPFLGAWRQIYQGKPKILEEEYDSN